MQVMGCDQQWKGDECQHYVTELYEDIYVFGFAPCSCVHFTGVSTVHVRSMGFGVNRLHKTWCLQLAGA